MVQNNEGFTCRKCRAKVDKHPGTSCRNHCPICLYSLHVDLEVPGDRANDCEGLMKPIGFENNKKKGMRIQHQCQKCGFKGWNRIAEDDSFELLCQLSRIPKD